MTARAYADSSRQPSLRSLIVALRRITNKAVTVSKQKTRKQLAVVVEWSANILPDSLSYSHRV